MATPRYRIIDEKGAYMPRSPEVQLLQLGADIQAARIFGIRACVCELLQPGTEIEFLGAPGPHLEPLNEEAVAEMAKYRKARPNATLDPTRDMPLGQDPFMTKSFEQVVLGRLDAQLAASQSSAPAEDPRIEALLAATAAMQQMMMQMVALNERAPAVKGAGR